MQAGNRWSRIARERRRKRGGAGAPGGHFPRKTSDPAAKWHRHCKCPTHAHPDKIKASPY